MNEFTGHLDRVALLVDVYSGCSPEQALVYSCEDIADVEFPSRVLGESDVAGFVESIVDMEGMEAPRVLVHAGRGRTLASANLEEGLICLHRRSTNASTVIHELAHHNVHVDNHGVLFRDELVRLMRRHVSVEHASFLYQLMSRSGLELSPWHASGHR